MGAALEWRAKEERTQLSAGTMLLLCSLKEGGIYFHVDCRVYWRLVVVALFEENDKGIKKEKAYYEHVTGGQSVGEGLDGFFHG